MSEFEKLPEQAERFIMYLGVVRGRSENTVSEYRHDLLSFFRYIYAVDNKIDPSDSETLNKTDVSVISTDRIKKIDYNELLQYLSYYKLRKKNNSTTIARKMSSLRSFYKYMVNNGVITENPAAKLETPGQKKSLPKYLTLEESKKLLNAVLEDKNSKTVERDYAIITLFLNCGMRLSELCGIKLTDLSSDLESVVVLGKGNKERLIYLNDACKKAIADYLKVRPENDVIKDEDKNALFISSRFYNRISDKTVQHIVYKYLDLAGLHNRKLSVHKLRHTAATLMYQSGKVDTRVLKDILGHSQLNTTQIYTHISDNNMKEAMNNNPLSDIKSDEK